MFAMDFTAKYEVFKFVHVVIMFRYPTLYGCIPIIAVYDNMVSSFEYDFALYRGTIICWSQGTIQQCTYTVCTILMGKVHIAAYNLQFQLKSRPSPNPSSNLVLTSR
ncbi:hypothetical protein BDN72DRAFT_198282 [Pluteus cervinus]|uniref:Uncharacterized protein n=1 Tax=Pluteus cervinus TaxID=181527 RepID=A0ACD3B6N3_9AGAR|nr:hypothetical protein BDN72DRAFT_198282 [Pluteus cervinus]